MHIQPQTVNECYLLSYETEAFLVDEGHRRGHAIKACACNVCESARLIEAARRKLELEIAISISVVTPQHGGG